jgi:septal ring-binding cell division protein DamX
MSKDETQETRGVTSSVLLVAAVAVVMVAGMVLKTEPPRELPIVAGTSSPAPALPLGSTVTPELPPAAPTTATAPIETPPSAEPTLASAPIPTPTQTDDPLLATLAARAADDCARLRRARGRWTAQLLVACKPETVDRLLGNARGSSGLYVLPAHVNDNACFRVCFGAYATSKEAAAASDLPKALRGKEKIGAVEIAKVLP